MRPITSFNWSMVGTISLSANNEINNSTKLNVNGGTFAVGSFNETVDTVTLTSGSITGTGGTLTSTNTIQTKAGSISAILAGTNGLTQSTTGTTILSGANTYTGATTINGGNLQVSGSLASGSAVSVNNTATLSGTGSANGSVSVASGGTVAPGTSPGTLSTGSLTFVSGATLSEEIQSTSTLDKLVVTGSVDLTGATLSVVAFGSPVVNDGDVFLIINNDGTSDAVTGTFSGLADGAIVSTDFLGSGKTARITYVGGDGNDVAIVVDQATVVATVPNDGNANAISLNIVGNTLQVVSDGNVIDSYPLNGITNLDITGVTGQNDTLTVDLTANPALANLGTITFHGGGDSADKVAATGMAGGSDFVLDYDDLDPKAGILTIDGVLVIDFDGIGNNTITIGGTVDDLTINFGDAAANIVFTAIDATTSQVAGTGFVTTTFTNPANSLAVTLGSDGDSVTFTDLADNFNPSNGVTVTGGAGADTIAITDLGDTFGNTTTGSLTISGAGASDSVSFGGVQSLASLSVTAETITQTAALTVSGTTTVDVGGTGSATLTQSNNFATFVANGGDIDVTDSGAIILGTISVSTLDVIAGGAVTQSAAATVTGATTVNAGANAVTLTQANDFQGNVSASGSSVQITDANSLAVALVAATTTVTLTATAGAITDGNGASDNVTGTSLSASAATGINLDTAIATLTSANVSGTGAIDISDSAGGLTVTSATTTDGAITLAAAGGDLTLATVTAVGTSRNISASTTTSGDILVGNVTATGDTITLNSAGAINESGTDAGDDLTAAILSLTATTGIGGAGQIEINANTTGGSGLTASVTGTGVIDLRDSTGLRVNSATTNDGSITIEAANGSLTLTTVTAGGTGANIVANTLAGTGNIDVGVLTASGDLVTLTAFTNITDANGATNNIAAATVALRADSGIGSDSDAIETTISGAAATLTIAAQTNTGDIRISNSGSLTIGTVDGLVGITILDTANDNSGNDNITLAAASPVTVNQAIVNNDGGNISLSSSNNGGNDDHLTISANITILGGDAAVDGDGNISLTAGTDLLVNSAASVSTNAGGTITTSSVRSTVLSGSSILQTADGSLSVTANSGATTGTFAGIGINNATVTSATGNITLTGTGGSTGNGNVGVVIQNAGKVQSTTSGTVSITGTGVGSGGSGNSNNHGVFVTGSNSKVTAVSGAISISGTNGTVTGSNNEAVLVDSTAVIQSTGSGVSPATITVLGNITSAGAGPFHEAIHVVGATITSVNGAILLNGTNSGGNQGGEGIVLRSNALVESTGTGASAATITLIGTCTNTSGAGIGIDAATVRAVDGAISITGTADANSAHSNGGDRGVVIQGGSVIQSTGTGSNAATIQIVGNGGDPMGHSNYFSSGVFISGSGTLITSVAGNVQITGTGGPDSLGTTSNHDGVVILAGAVVSSTGSGLTPATITISGTGGTVSSSNDGVVIAGAGSQIATVNGAISITGTGRGTAGDGIRLASDATLPVVATGTATITLSGDGTGAETGLQIDAPLTSNSGAISLSSADSMTFGVNGDVTSTSGSIAATADTAVGNNGGAFTQADGALINAGSGLIDLDADGNITLGGLLTTSSSTSAVTIDSTSGSIIDGGNAHIDIVASNGRAAITATAGNIGTLTNPIALSLTSLTTNTSGGGNQFFTEADSLTWNTSTAGSGTVTLVSGTFLTGSSQTITAGTVTVASGAVLGGTGTVSGAVTTQSGGDVSPGASPGVLNTGNLTLVSGSDLNIELNGTTVGTQYDQVNVTGSVSLGNANLNATLGYVPAINDAFTIINNDGGDAVSGVLNVAGNPVAQGGSFIIPDSTATSDQRLTVDYAGGTGGNDVVLTVQRLRVDLSVSANAGTEAGTTVITVTATAEGRVFGDQTIDVVVTGTGITIGDYTWSNTAGADATISILGGTTSASITFTIDNDQLLEGNQTAILTLANPSSRIMLGTTTTQNIVITDNETGVVDFQADQMNAETVDPTVKATLTITPNGTGPVGLETSFSVTATNAGTGTATSGSDFAAFGSQTLTFAVGNANGSNQIDSSTGLIDVTSDRRLEGDQTVDLTIAGSLSSTLNSLVSIGDATHTATIIDDEVGVIDFQADQSNDESVDPTIRAILTITPIGTGTVALENTLTVLATNAPAGTATSGVDYVAFAPATLTISAGNANGSNQINSSTATLDVINDRRTKEGNETVNFTLSNLNSIVNPPDLSGQVSLGDTTHTATIQENDFITVAGLANGNEGDPYCLDVTLNLNPAPDASTGYTINWDDGTTSVFGPGGLSNGTIERQHIYDDDIGPGLSTTYNVTLDTVESLGSYTDQANPSPHTVTIHNVNPRDGASFGPVSYTGEDLYLACNSTASFPSGTQSMTGTRLNLTNTVYEGIVMRMPLVAAGLATNATSITFTITADWDMLSSDNDLGIAITDGTTAVGSNFGDNGGGFLWGEQGTVSGNRLINTFYPSVGSLTRTTPFTMNLTVASNGQITVSGTNASNVTKTYISTKTLTLSNQLDLILVGENLGESYGLKTLTVQVAATGTDLVNDGPINEGSTGTVSFVAPLSPNVPFDPSNADTVAKFHYAFDMDNDGAFDDGFGDGTYAGSSDTTGTATIPASFLDDGNSTLTVRGRIIDKDGGFTDYLSTVTINNVAPTATLANGGPVDEGSTGSVSFSGAIDPSAADTFFGFHYAYDFDNDGTFDNGNGTYAGSSDTTGTATVPASYLNDGPATRLIKARIIDKNDGYTDYYTAITVNNVAPVFDAGANETLTTLANGAFSRTGIAITDVSPVDTFSGTVSYGDGINNQFQQVSINQLTRTFSLSHTYQTSGTYLVTVTITDDDGGTLTDTFTVTATVATAHLPQVAANLPSVTVNEGQTATNSGTFGDASGHAVTLTASVGTITPGAGTWTWSYATTDGGGQSQTVTITATDSTGAVNTTTFGLTVNNVAPTAGSGASPFTLGPTSYTGLALNSLAGVTFPTGTRVVNGTRLDLSGSVVEGIVLRMPLVTAGSISNAQTAVFTVTANWDALTSDNDFGITVSDGVKAVGVNLGDNGGGFLWGEYGTVSGTSLTGVSYPSPGSLSRVMSFTMQVTVTPAGITVKGTNGIGANLSYTVPSSTKLNLANQIDLILTRDSAGEVYGLKTLTTQVNVTGGGGLTNNGPKPLNSSLATVSFVSPTDVAADVSAGLRYAYDFNNDGTFDTGNGTYSGSVTSPSVSVPAIYLSSLGVRTIRGRIIDKDGGFTDYLTDLVVQ